MRPPRSVRAVLATALAVLVGASACGEDPTERSATSTTTSETSAATDTTAADTTDTTRVTGPDTTTDVTGASTVPVRTGGPTVRRDGRPDESGLATVEPDGTAPPRDPMSSDWSTWPEYRLATRAVEVGSGTRALGSGCAPTDPDRLDDGLWYGFVNGLRDGVVSVDVACWWVGDLATVPGCEDEVGLDSCVLNVADRERTAPLARDATFHLPRRFTEPEFIVNVDATFDEFADWLALPGNDLGVWVAVDRGAVTELEVVQLLAG